MRIQVPPKKLIYPLREVCRLSGLSDKVIKRWEKQYPQIKPIRNRASNRSYLEKDLKLIFYIRDLVYVHKLDADTVKEKLKAYHPAKDFDSDAYLKSVIAEIKMEVEEIRTVLDSE